MWEISQEAVDRGVIIYTEGQERNFKWNTREVASERGENITSESWYSIFATRDDRFRDETEIISLKKDLVEHLWQKKSFDVYN